MTDKSMEKQAIERLFAVQWKSINSHLVSTHSFSKDAITALQEGLSAVTRKALQFSTQPDDTWISVNADTAKLLFATHGLSQQRYIAAFSSNTTSAEEETIDKYFKDNFDKLGWQESGNHTVSRPYPSSVAQKMLESFSPEVRNALELRNIPATDQLEEDQERLWLRTSRLKLLVLARLSATSNGINFSEEEALKKLFDLGWQRNGHGRWATREKYTPQAFAGVENIMVRLSEETQNALRMTLLIKGQKSAILIDAQKAELLAATHGILPRFIESTPDKRSR